jgi:hypothetical protein
MAIVLFRSAWMIKIKIPYTMVFFPCPIEKKQRSLKIAAILGMPGKDPL